MIAAGAGQLIVGVVFPVGVGFEGGFAVATPPQDTSKAQIGTKTASKTKEKNEDLFRTQHLDQDASQNAVREK